MEHGTWLKDFVVFLVAASLVVPLFHRARIGAVLGFLLVGLVVGPHGLGRLLAEYPWIRYLTIEDRSRVEPFAELGIVFLLFLIGIELSIGRLWTLRRLVLGIGSAQFFLSAVLIGSAIAATGFGTATATVLGLCLAMSSTAIVIQLLEEQGRSGSPVGRIAISVLLFQDLMVPLVLFVTGLLGRGGGGVALTLGTALLQAAIAVIAIGTIGYYLVRPLFRFAAQAGGREFILAITLLIVIGMAGVTGYFGLSSALGAFLAGLLLAETEYRHQVEIDLAPVKGLLLGLFFITVGMTVDLFAAWQQIGLILTAVAVLLLLKATVLYFTCRMFGMPLGSAAEIAILLAQAGEFAFVIIALGGFNGAIPPDLAQTATVIVGLSMMVTPLCAAAARRLGERLRRNDNQWHMPADIAAELTGHVVIGGFGRVGQTIATILEAENIPVVALDTDSEVISEQRRAKRPVYFGDAGRREFLERAGAAKARAFVVTVNAPRAAERMVAAVRQIRSDAPTLARAVSPDHAIRLLRLGAIDVIPDATEASLQLAARLLEALGLPDDAVDHRIEQIREQELGRLHAEIKNTQLEEDRPPT
ncbi:MAG TPA: cation:proton antiporter [Xanthobacteraceae bacterium]|nr:cation:proton antiporter [Xanthobacteraceae bacterium]